MVTKTPKREQLLEQLPEPQRSLVQEYHALQNSPFPPDDAASRRLQSIRDEAQTNPILRKLLDPLNDHQKSLVEEYYKLQSSPFIPGDAVDKRLCFIWTAAQTDSVLRKRLELVDDLCNSFPEDVTEEEDDHRTYWAEYLVPQLQAKLDQEDEQFSCNSSGECSLASWMS